MTKQKFFINEHQKNFDPHVSCRLGRVMANQHIFKTRLNLYFLNQIDLNASFLMELNFINTLGWEKEATPLQEQPPGGVL